MQKTHSMQLSAIVALSLFVSAGARGQEANKPAGPAEATRPRSAAIEPSKQPFKASWQLALAKLRSETGPIALRGSSAFQTIFVPISARMVLKSALLHVEFEDGMVADIMTSELVLGGIYDFVEVFANNHRTRCRIRIRQQGFAGQSRVRFAESGFTGIAAPALNPALTEVTKSLAGLVLASEAGHGFSPLAFCGEKPQNQFGSRSWLTPRFGLAPTPVSAEAGALSCYLAANRWGPLHRLSPRFSRRAVLPALRGSYLAPKSFLLCPCRQPENHTAFLCRLTFEFFSLYKPLCGSHYGSERLRIFLDIEAGLLKLLSHLSTIQSIVALRNDVHNGIAKTRRFSAGILDFLQNLLTLRFVRNETNQSLQRNT